MRYIGRSLCIGKNLALMNIRATVSRLIMAFNFELPANQGFGDLETNARERFSLHFDDIKVIVKKRK
jgi:tryprostatin B 6-hydroxylase